MGEREIPRGATYRNRMLTAARDDKGVERVRDDRSGRLVAAASG